jgi:ABC-type lipoprotein export system ATPase subunit
MSDATLLQWPLSRLLAEHPYARDFFCACNVPDLDQGRTVAEVLHGLPPDRLETLGMNHATIAGRLLAFIEQMQRLQAERDSGIERVTVVGGFDKEGVPENVRVTLTAGEVVAVVGPTGAGKSLLLADIECLAQGDTPSGRRILINDRPPDETQRLSGEQRLVAQLSQNMNFVMDLSVQEFLALHAESRLVADVDGMVVQILETAVGLAGEPFDGRTPVTALSGGQSRALMIADVACLSASPIVLIDEIENAGVDRRQALALLIKKEKIVLMATHDPLLALSGSRRLVIRNGGIVAELRTSSDERTFLRQLDAMDARLVKLRDRIRQGQRLSAGESEEKEQFVL